MKVGAYHASRSGQKQADYYRRPGEISLFLRSFLYIRYFCLALVFSNVTCHLSFPLFTRSWTSDMRIRPEYIIYIIDPSNTIV
jgi:hypothetical protein